MITIEANVGTERVSQICLTDPHDGGSRERNAKETEEWKEKVLKEHPEAKFAAYFD